MEKEWLRLGRVQTFSPGSWITTIWAKTKKAKTVLTLLARTVYREGRENMLRRIRAETRIKQVEAESKEFDLFARKLAYVQKIVKKNPNLHAIVNAQIESSLIKLLDGSDSNVKVTEIKSDLMGVQSNPPQDHEHSDEGPSM